MSLAATCLATFAKESLEITILQPGVLKFPQILTTLSLNIQLKHHYNSKVSWLHQSSSVGCVQCMDFVEHRNNLVVCFGGNMTLRSAFVHHHVCLLVVST
jgi:hypothetical protein